MHLPDGMLSGGLSVAGYLGTVGVHLFTYIVYVLKGCKKFMNIDIIPKVSLVSAALLVAALIYVPVGPTTVHFSFVGVAGILLGPYSVISFTVVLFFQVILFYHGGFTSLGVNIFNFSVAALAGYYIFAFMRTKLPLANKIPLLNRFKLHYKILCFAFLAGLLSKLILVVLGSLALLTIGFPLAVPGSVIAFHLPIMLAEGVLTAVLVFGLLKLKRGIIYNESSFYDFV
ncbi:energy-coupling factor ABC transporter permease [Natranaerofaba carboxydovora]|uniref:energy-coupling factor ABC transporter permease n=1 Tax=Natranaerofaba carboxydovora TaxID=2742683 RepID=UPI001F13041B|nr:energy-coupling factor ABC transporter permease [Natranaerofaba carboxydovora]UMZ72687.1 Fused nickel transport protein NikMN [Natranaerofaba carboxydovora]